MERDIIFYHFGPFFAFYPTNNPEIQNSRKMKKPPWHVIILHMSTINENHMKYGSWEMECDRQKFLSLWDILCPFTPLTTRKIKILEKWKNRLDMLSFYIHMCTINENHMKYGSWEMECDTQNFLSIWDILCPFTPLTTRKIKILK